MLHKLRRNAAQVWQQCCKSMAAMLRKSKSVLIRGLEHASESVKALILGCKSIDSRVRKDASEGVGVLLFPL